MFAFFAGVAVGIAICWAGKDKTVAGAAAIFGAVKDWLAAVKAKI